MKHSSTIIQYHVCEIVTVQQKIVVVVKFAQMVTTKYKCMHTGKLLADLKRATKPLNVIPRQIFRATDQPICLIATSNLR